MVMGTCCPWSWALVAHGHGHLLPIACKSTIGKAAACVLYFTLLLYNAGKPALKVPM